MFVHKQAAHYLVSVDSHSDVGIAEVIPQFALLKVKEYALQ